jgi:hypothetical protein
LPSAAGAAEVFADARAALVVGAAATGGHEARTAIRPMSSALKRTLRMCMVLSV